MRQSKNLADNANKQQTNVEAQSLVIAGMPVSGIAFLVLTAIISLLWSSSELLLWDEFLSLWTDRLPSMAQIVHIQRTYPMSVDPLVYHAVAHIAVLIFGAGPFAMRLPSLMGFLTMQVCLFFFVRRITNEHAAVFALAFPALTSALFFSINGRPYGLMLGFIALAMVSWQSATRRGSKRTPWLITLALAIALAINVHYFGVLLLAPLCIAELYRSRLRRRIDIPVLTAIAAGAAGVVTILPFLKAAAVFRAHYRLATPKLELIPEAYLAMFPHFRGSRIEALFDAFFVVAALVVLSACFRQLRRGSVLLPEAEAVFLLTLAFLPFLGYILALLTSKALEPRYVIGAFPAITALLAIGLGPVFRQNGVRKAVLIAMFFAVTLAGVRYIYIARKTTYESLKTLNIAPEVRGALIASTTGQLYFQDAERFAFASYYEPDAEIRSRMVLVYSQGQELKWKHMDTMAFIAVSMRNSTSFNIEPYESVNHRTGDFVFAVDDEPGVDWTIQAFEDAHAKARSVGSAFDVDVVTVQFLPKP